MRRASAVFGIMRFQIHLFQDEEPSHYIFLIEPATLRMEG